MIEIHFQQVKNRERCSGSNKAIRSSISLLSNPRPNTFNTNPLLTIDSNSDSSTDSEDFLDQAINRNVIRFGTQPNINQDSLNSSSSTNNSADQTSQRNDGPPTTVAVKNASGDAGNTNTSETTFSNNPTSNNLQSNVNVNSDDIAATNNMTG